MTGIIPLKKGENITSFFAVNKVRRLVGEKKAGHTGTLDPNATGVLPIAMGGATRFIELLPTHKKAYKSTFKTGFRTDTLDIWGTVTETFDKKASFDEVLKAVEGFKGEIMQLPPMYSALKKDGVRLYELARQGKEVERTPRKCEIYQLKAERINDEEYSLYCECSAGTYIRTLCADIGAALGCGGVMSALMRTECAGFSLEDAHTLEQIEALSEEEREKVILPVEVVFEKYKKITLPPFFTRLARCGVEIYLKKINVNAKVGERFTLYDESGFYALGEVREFEDGPAIKPIKQFDV